MADEDQDDSQKTEDPTQKRLDDALKKGQVTNSREVTSFMMLFALAIILIWLAPAIMYKTLNTLTGFIDHPEAMDVSGKGLQVTINDLLTKILFIMIPPLGIILGVIYFSSFIQHPIVFSGDSIMPKLERISPLKGLGRLFSLRTVVEFVKGILKIILVGVVSYIAIYPDLQTITHFQSDNIMSILLLVAKLTKSMMIGICSMMALFAAMDFLYQYFEHMKSLRMSKRDMKDEFKQTEGNPEIKAKLREIRNRRANKRMMAAVPTADVVITNPTHYSIALKYEQEKTEAPIVVAKGMDFMALKIREIAKENNVPIVENPPLARALYSSVELEQEVPFEHYNAVAEVIRYVYKLKGKIK
jgi:flagellar biosynthetic protein FlhB